MPWHDSVQIMDMTVENVDMMWQKRALMWGYGEKLDTDSILYAITYGPSARTALDDENPLPPTHFLPSIAVVTGHVPITQGMMHNGLVRARVYD